jgi:hypothetical protein
VDGWELFPVRPLGISPGAYFELDGVSAGPHTWSAVTGAWYEWGSRFVMYTYRGSFTQPASGSLDIHIPDQAVKDLLGAPPASLGYWEGYYFDAGNACHSAAFKFNQDGTFIFYNANNQADTGAYSLVKRSTNINTFKFHAAGSGWSGDGLLVETQAAFTMNNGPASWPKITYVYRPQGYVRNPACP